MATTKLEDVLAYVPLFRGLNKRQLKHLAGLMEVADFMLWTSLPTQAW